MIVKALLTEYNGGKHGKTGERIAIVKPQFFKNGKMKKSGFEELQEVEVIKKGYRFGTANHNEVITKVIEVIKED